MPRSPAGWLKATHQLGHVQAHVVASVLDQYDDPAALVDAQYAGPRKGLRPIYEAVVKAARKVAKDVTMQPCKTYVPLHRAKTFALVKPAAGAWSWAWRCPARDPLKGFKSPNGSARTASRTRSKSPRSRKWTPRSRAGSRAPTKFPAEIFRVNSFS